MDNAVLFRPGDQEGFRAAIARLAADRNLRERLAASALATVRRRELTWKRNAERVVELAAELVAARRGRRELRAADVV
jgi:glycosyltransferase involved in cell wall biosynthesis